MTGERVSLNGGTCPQATESRIAGSVTAPDLVSVLNTVDVPIIVLRRDFTISYFNKSASSVLELSATDLNRAPSENPVMSGMARLKDTCSKVVATEAEMRIDFRHKTKWFVVRISPHWGDDARCVGTVLTVTNVTAFRASIDLAIYERECSKAILNTVADPLVVLGADERIQSGNRAFYAMFDVSREQTQGGSLYELGNGSFELASLRKQCQQMFAGCDKFEPIEVESYIVGKGRRTIVVHARPLSLPGHSERRALLTFQDITIRKQAEEAINLRAISERKRSEEELRRSEAFLAEAQRLSVTGSSSWRVETDEITWSDQLYRIFEITPPLTPARIRSRVHPDDLDMFDATLAQAKARGDDFECQYRLLMPDLSVKHLHAVTHATWDSDGKLEYIATVQDVTERRLSDEALDAARSELARVTRVMSLGALTASIAHEVNQPLSGIITNAGTCWRMLNSDPPNLEGARETVRRTLRDGNRASEVIARLRALFDNRSANTEPVDLNEVAREVISLLLSEIRRKKIRLGVELADDLPIVVCDRVQIQQVIMNLIRNACDALSRVSDRPRTLIVRSDSDDGSVGLSVCDVGTGFDREAADRLFDAFYTTKESGMGIGLSVSQSIIKSHGGELSAMLNEGPGATFTFRLPRD
ncbi:PAS domain-containing sensor histidine kinase [Tardiphaga sp. 862_B3_N1_1]|uniref:PAS domain-containing sensor histidine kinase n=1 Tax=Tardiphaga sp. 862_B3_N1_1 TaxID=3240763 RepID=UPI003F8A27EA